MPAASEAATAMETSEAATHMAKTSDMGDTHAVCETATPKMGDIYSAVGETATYAAKTNAVMGRYPHQDPPWSKICCGSSQPPLGILIESRDGLRPLAAECPIDVNHKQRRSRAEPWARSKPSRGEERPWRNDYLRLLSADIAEGEPKQSLGTEALTRAGPEVRIQLSALSNYQKTPGIPPF